MKPPEYPSIKNELSPVPKKKIELGNLRPRGGLDDRTVNQNSVEIGSKWGASTQLSEKEPAIAVTPLTSIRGYIPQYLDDDLSRKAAERRVTKTFLMLEAFAQAGYRVEAEDLVQDRRKGQKSKV